MGKAAARMGDMVKTCNDPTDMPTSSIISTTTRVFIDKLPAAKMNDKVVGVDIHIIMIPSPGGPVPTPLPHPYNGAITMQCSTTVKIEGQFAAVVGSKSMGQPPHIPQGGPFQKPPTNQGEIMMGSTTVFINDGGGGGGGGGGSSVTKQTARTVAKQGAVTKATTSSSDTSAEAHELDVQFVDKGGLPVSGPGYTVKYPGGQKVSGNLAGGIKTNVPKSGDHEIALRTITRATWSATKARNGEKVTMTAEGIGFEDDDKATFLVWKKDFSRPDKLLARFPDVALSGQKAEQDWTYEYTEDDDYANNPAPRYSSPKFYFTVAIGNLHARSGNLDYKDFVEIKLKGGDGNPAKGADYKLYTSSGEIRTGKLDDNGYAKEENVPPGPTSVTFPGQSDTAAAD